MFLGQKVFNLEIIKNYAIQVESPSPVLVFP